ncbi:MAG: hypothetical protein V8R55_03440 [Dysosmobacter sp.]
MNGTMRAGTNTISAPNAFGMIWMTKYIHIHAARLAAHAAGGAGLCINREPVK